MNQIFLIQIQTVASDIEATCSVEQCLRVWVGERDFFHPVLLVIPDVGTKILFHHTPPACVSLSPALALSLSPACWMDLFAAAARLLAELTAH